MRLLGSCHQLHISSDEIVPTSLPPRPTDATLSVTKAARLLGVHPNTVRAWSDAGRLRYYRINPRGDRRYRLSDLQRFLAAAETGAVDGIPSPATGAWGGRRTIDPAAAARFASGRRGEALPAPADPLDAERHQLDLTILATVARSINASDDPDEALDAVVRAVRDAYGHHLVAIWEVQGDHLTPRAVAGAELGAMTGPQRLLDVPLRAGLLGRTLALATGRDRRSRGPLSAILLGDDPGDAALAVLPDGRPELAVAIPGDGGPWGALLVIGETRGSLDPRDLDVARVVGDGIGAIVSGAATGRGGRAPAPPGRGAQPGRQRHRQPARPGPDPGRAGRPRHGAVRRRPGSGLPRAGRRPRRGRGQPRPVAVLPEQRPRRPGPVAGGGRGRRAPAALLGRLPRRPARRGRPRRRGPGRVRHAVHGTAPGRHAAARDAQRLPRPAAPVDGRRPRHGRGAGDPGERRHPGGAGLRADGDLGGPAPVDPAARRPPEPAVERGRDRPVDRDRAAPADRLPQRPGVPAHRP